MNSNHDEDAAAYRERMQRTQASHKQRVSERKRPDRGLILVHTGNGKGKSTSAFGVVARALGWGNHVAVVQFIKGKWKTGEKQFFQRFPDLLTWHTMGDGFTWDTQDKEQDTVAAQAALAKGAEFMQSGRYALVVLDEINIALRYGFVSVEQVLDTLAQRSEKTSVILTGRDAPDALQAAADLVTEMREVKHPFQAGIKAQRGIDF
jgi:cob(I)alamin adenosyltransferase